MPFVAFVILLSGLAFPIVLVLAAIVVYAVVGLVLLYREGHDRWAPAFAHFVVGHLPSAQGRRATVRA
jgi:hypothetical protein